MFEEIIKILLDKRVNLVADKEAELNAFAEELDAKYAEREEQIQKLLDDAGYVEPVVEEVVEETEAVEEVAEVTEAAEEVQAEATEEDWR